MCTAVKAKIVTWDELSKSKLLPGLLFDILRCATNVHIFVAQCACVRNVDFE